MAVLFIIVISNCKKLKKSNFQMSANKGAIVIVVNVITENLFYIYLYPATYQTLFDISIFKFTKLNNYPLQLIIN